MTWVRLDDHFDQHPKLASAGPLGMALWVTGLAYCNRNLTDGFIPWSTARTLLPWRHLAPPDETGGRKIITLARTSGMVGDDVDSDFVIELLLDAGLWEEIDGGYQVHDYDDYQPTKEQVEAERALKQAAGRAGGQASAKARAKANGQAKSNPVPVPVPVPDTVSDPKVAAAARAYEETIGQLNAYDGQLLAEAVETYGETCVIHCFKEAAESGVRTWKYSKAIMKRHAKEGCYEAQPEVEQAPGVRDEEWESAYVEASVKAQAAEREALEAAEKKAREAAAYTAKFDADRVKWATEAKNG